MLDLDLSEAEMAIGEDLERGPQHDRLYRGWRTKDGSKVVVVEGPLANRELHLGDPDWGVESPGTLALARVLLQDAIAAPEARERGLADRLSEAFAAEVLATLPRQEPWILWRLDILEWAHDRLELDRPS